MKTLVYIGNDFQFSVMVLLRERLAPHFHLHAASAKRNKFARLLDMCHTVWCHRKTTDWVIIDTYSTLNFWYAWIVALICRAYRIQYFTYLHGGKLPQRLESSPRMAAAIFKYSRGNIAPSAYLQAAFESKGYRTAVIPNFIDLENYPFILRAQPQPRLLWVRSFDKVYNPAMAIRVFAGLQQLYPEAQLCMVGPAKDTSLAECQSLVRELGLLRQVTFTGRLSKSAWIALAANYDIFINSSNIDNTPISLIEAMALGLPIASTDVGGVPYLLDHGKDGLLSPPNDAAAMLENVMLLIREQQLSQNISRNARQKAEQLDWKIVKQKWLKLLQ